MGDWSSLTPIPTEVYKKRGRPKGSRNKSTLEAKEAAGEILESAEYRESLIVRAKAGTLPPQIETMLWHYRYGKPIERLEVSDLTKQLAELSDEQLAERLEKTTDRVRQIMAARAATRMVTEVMEEHQNVPVAEPKHTM